jgi:hypothetical protein
MSPFVIAGVLRTMSAILGLGAALALCLRTLGDISSTRLRTVAAAVALLFWVAPFFHARFMSENWGGALGVLGLCLMRFETFLQLWFFRMIVGELTQCLYELLFGIEHVGEFVDKQLPGALHSCPPVVELVKMPDENPRFPRTH